MYPEELLSQVELRSSVPSPRDWLLYHLQRGGWFYWHEADAFGAKHMTHFGPSKPRTSGHYVLFQQKRLSTAQNKAAQYTSAGFSPWWRERRMDT